MYANTPEVRALVAAAFPDYNGKRFMVEVFRPMSLASYWSGGSRDYFAFVDMRANRAIAVPENGTPFVNGGEATKCEKLPDNLALVKHACGRYEHCVVYVPEANLTKMIGDKVDLGFDQRVVLCATRTLKSSYGPNKDLRFTQSKAYTGMEREAWEKAKAELIEMGMLNKAGAITDAGKNAIGNTSLWELGREKKGATA